MQGYRLPSPELRLPSRSLLSNLLITLTSLGLIVWAFQLLQTRFTSVVSTDAVINGAVVEIKAPEEGMVSTMTVATGDAAKSGQSLVVLKNERVSELQLQEINSRLSDRNAELQRAQARLDQLLGLAAIAATDNQAQYRLENVEIRRSIDQMNSDLRGAESRLRLAKISRDRAAMLQSEGAIALANLDSAQVEMEQRQAEVDSIRDRLAAMQANQEAAEQGLALDRTRSNYDPRIRLQELQVQIADQQELVSVLEQSIKAIEAELAQAKLEAERQQTIDIGASRAGVIWSLAVQPGTFVQQGESLGQLLDCNRRWVDAIVDERTLRSLQIGTPATIELYGDSSRTLQGEVSMIRPGMGRLSPGEDVAIPIAANTPRTAQVRVALAPDPTPESQERLCYVGYTGKVTFHIR